MVKGLLCENPTDETFQKIQNLFEQLSLFPDSLPQNLSYPILAMKPHSFQDFKYDALRTIIRAYDLMNDNGENGNNDDKDSKFNELNWSANDQFKNMTFFFAKNFERCLICD